MRWTSITAIYSLFWAFSFFLVIPFRPGARNPTGDVEGEMPGAPPAFHFGRACLWTTVVATVAFGLYYANYVNGWIPVEALDLFHDD